jgi:c-di-GMP-binding flagellar brake protein YcgR
MGVNVVMNDAPEERRLAQRVIINSITQENNGAKFTRINDISLGGMNFTAPFGLYDIHIGDILNFSLSFPDLSGNSLWGEIRHVHNNPDQMIHYGVKFLKLNWSIWSHLANLANDKVEIKKLKKLPDEELIKITELQKNISHDFYAAKLAIDRPLDGELQDINLGGASLLIAETVPIDKHVIITILFEKNMLVLEGVCVWCSRVHEETNSVLMGVSFKHLDRNQFYLLSELVLKFNHLIR